MANEDIFIEGMQLLLQQVEEELARAETDQQRLVEALTLAQSRVDQLAAKRNKIVAALTAKAEAIQEYAPTAATAQFATRPIRLAGGGPSWPLPPLPLLTLPPLPVPPEQPQSRRTWRADVVRRIENLLRPGRPLATKNIFYELSAQGVDFNGIKNPLHRLVQIMSETAHFHADRKHGWSLSAAPYPSLDDSALSDASEGEGPEEPTGTGGLES